MAFLDGDDKLTISEKIEKQLLISLQTDGYLAHDKFLSEKKIAAMFNCNDATARKTITRLVVAGHLYRIKAKGTFVSPIRKHKMILLVMPTQENSLIRYCSNAKLQTSVYSFHEISETEFLQSYNDIEHIFPEVKGVLFYRDLTHVSYSFEVLKKKNIPFAFYGSSVNASLLKNEPTLFYDEKAIVNLAMDKLVESGCRKIGFISNGLKWATIEERHHQYLTYLQNNSLSIDPAIMWSKSRDSKYYEDIADFAEYFKHNSDNVDGFFAVTDNCASIIIQAAMIANLALGKELKVVGVNNDVICELAGNGISSIDIPIPEDTVRVIKLLINVIEDRKVNEKLQSNIIFIKRGSC